MNLQTEPSDLRSSVGKTLAPATTSLAMLPLAMLPLAVLASCFGCSGGPSALSVPGYNPSGSAQKAMELYDKDENGVIDEEELKSAPGLRASMATVDTNNDGKVSEEEIKNRLLAWDKAQIGLMMFSCDVRLNGKPLSDATITLDPDGFLEGILQSAVGTTSLAGSARPKIPKENRPTPDSPPGLQAGIYKVRISKIVGGKETIPAKYNTETILGQEVSMDDPSISNNQVVYKLKS